MKSRSRSMRSRLVNRQRGMSIWLAIILVLLLVVVGGTALKATPSVIEYMAIEKAVDTSSAKGDSPAKIRDLFQRQADVNDVSSISSKDLAIVKDGDGYKVTYEYEKLIPLAGPASLLILYKRGDGNPNKEE